MNTLTVIETKDIEKKIFIFNVHFMNFILNGKIQEIYFYKMFLASYNFNLYYA